MTNVLKSLRALTAETGILRHNPLALPLDPRKELSTLIEAHERLRLESRRPGSIPRKLDAEAIWQRFMAFEGDISRLNGREIRALCWDSEFAVRLELVRALRANPAVLMRRTCLNGLVNSYFFHWRSMEAAEDLESLLKGVITAFPRQCGEVVRWRSAQSLFSPRAADELAKFVIDRQANTAKVLELQYVNRNTRLAILTHSKVAQLATQRFRQTELTSSEETNLRILEWLIKNVLADEMVPPGALRSAISLLILSRSADKSAALQKELLTFVQRHSRLGDPRVRQSAPNWRDMEPEATQRFLSWLAKESILFFFNTILPSNDENRRRAEFWLRYHTKIRDFQVAISEQDQRKINANRAIVDIPLHSRVGPPATTSAFLMQFQGAACEYVIVEFSETGNAAHIHERSAFESRNVNLRTPYFQVNRHLKHERRGRLDRILHLGDWEGPTRQKLAQLGVRP